MAALSTKFWWKAKIFLTIYLRIGIFNEGSAFHPQPSFAEAIPNVTVSSGRDVSIPCVIENLGSYRVAWSHKEQGTLISIQHRVIIRSSRYKVTHSNYRTWYLHIENVQEKDSGQYMCQINTSPMIWQTGKINVVVPPAIDERETNTDTEVREGTDVSLKCVAKGFPTPKVKWRREDGLSIPIDKVPMQVVHGHYLNQTKVSRLQSGAYLCIAANGIPPSVSQRIFLNVNFPPMIWIPDQLVGAPIGSDVNLDCNLESYPKSVTYWTKDSGKMLVSGENYDSLVMPSGYYKVQMRLRIRNLREEDYGAYTCLAKNSLGETEGMIRLYEVAALPSVTFKKTLRTKLPSIEDRISISKDDNNAEIHASLPFHKGNMVEENGDVDESMKKGSMETGYSNSCRAINYATFLPATIFSLLYDFSGVF